MIFPLSIVSLFALVSLGLLASPWPYLAPGAVIGLVGFTVLYRKPTWGLLGIAALVPFEGFFKDSSVSGSKLLGASLAVTLCCNWRCIRFRPNACAATCGAT